MAGRDAGKGDVSVLSVGLIYQIRQIQKYANPAHGRGAVGMLLSLLPVGPA